MYWIVEFSSPTGSHGNLEIGVEATTVQDAIQVARNTVFSVEVVRAEVFGAERSASWNPCKECPRWCPCTPEDNCEA